ncbi:MAG: DoxX family membrane protein [Cypionkella sp.]
MTTTLDQRFLLALRLLLAWTFLYAASHQVFDPAFSIVGFLTHTKTFNGLFMLFTGPQIAPVVSFLVAYGHLAIGLSLLSGLLVRISAPVGAAILMFYWMAHMDFPFISDTNNFLVDFHVIYAVVLVYLAVKGAGRIYGLDGWLAQQQFVLGNPSLKTIFA